MAQRANDTNNWPELFSGLYERLTGNNAEISYDFDDFELDVPSSTADDAQMAHWKVNGKIRISTREVKR